MLLDLVTPLLAVLDAPDRDAAWHRYRDMHATHLAPWWREHGLDLHGPDATPVAARLLAVPRPELRRTATTALRHDVDDALTATRSALRADVPVDAALMIGFDATPGGVAVVQGRGVAVLCLEHFTTRPDAETLGLGLGPALLPAWLAAGVAKALRLTSRTSRSPLAAIVSRLPGATIGSDLARSVPLVELLLLEGVAVHAASIVAPEVPPERLLPCSRRQWQRLREMDATLWRVVETDLDRGGLGLWHRWLAPGAPAPARTVGSLVIPERAGVYLGWRLAEALVERDGISAALRAAPEEFRAAHRGVGAARRVRAPG